MINSLPEKFPLGFFPTPLHEMANFSSRYSGYRVFIKRDDHTGLATGGNKTRKLEYLIGDAIRRGADTIITAGAQQSNHCRQTAAACSIAKLSCHLLLGGNQPATYQGNLLLSQLLGATIHFTGEGRKGEDLSRLAEKLKNKEKTPYIIPYGGSNSVGAMGYVEAVRELKDQLRDMSVDIDYIFFASSSGGMQAGLILGSALYGFRGRLMPVQIDKQETHGLLLKDLVAEIVTEGSRSLHLQHAVDIGTIDTLRGYAEAGYGVVTDHETEAIRTLARTEGIMLDPVYTGRAFYGMMHHLDNNMLDPGTNILFWHTGGIPANFQHAKDLT